MGAMYRLKAYFGMVPADELADYPDDPRPDPGPRHESGYADGYADSYPPDAYPPDSYSAPSAEPWERRQSRPGGMERTPREPRVDREPVRGVSGLGPGSVRGALAVDPDAALREPNPREPVLREARPAERVATAVPEQRDRGATALSRITTLQPRSYKEARTIGERYRDGVPVIMNLTELDAAAAKRLVDFAAGLAFALRGSIDKVTNRVFLLTPADVEVSADDARRLAQRELFRQD